MRASLLLLSACVGLDPVGRVTDKPSGGDDTGGTSVSAGALSIDASALDFGTVALGDFADEIIGLTNTGTDPLALRLSVEGAAYAITTTTLDLTSTFSLTVTFAPEADGAAEGTLEVAIDGGETLSIPLSGIGGEGGGTETGGTGTAELLVSPSRYSFGSVDIGDTETISFTVANTGDEELWVSEVTTSGVVWGTGGSLVAPMALVPGANRLLDVSFTPSAAAAYTGTITLHTDDPDTPELELAVDGQGVDLCDLCQPVIDVDTGSEPYAISNFLSLFGSTDSKTITIRNVGDEDLEVTNVLVNNDTVSTCGTFTVTDWRGSTTLAPRASTDFSVNYRATETCVELDLSAFDENVLHILSSDPTQPDWAIIVTGGGL